MMDSAVPSSRNASIPPVPTLRILMHRVPSTNALPPEEHPLPPSVAISYACAVPGAPELATSGPPQL